MPAIVTNVQRILASDYFENDLATVPTYVYIGGTSPWVDENAPPQINDTVQDKYFSYEELVGAKRIQQADIISVIRRINWQEDSVYDEYNDRVNLIDDRNPETDEFYDYYVMTEEFNVYKCLSNNSRSPSTVQPSGTSINPFETPDGYIWKYMYTIRASDAFAYMTPNWIPCYTLFADDDSSQWLVQTSSVPGTIDHAIVTDGGASYDPANPPTVTITGDGSGAFGVAEVNESTGAIDKIIMTDPGSGYTSATITITDTVGAGVGATATPVVSPLKGHGADARTELGAIYKMIRVVVENDEAGVLPLDVEYRKVGMVSEPLSATETGVILTVADSTLYRAGDTIVGQTSTATGTVISINNYKSALFVSNVTGIFTENENVQSGAYNTTEVLYVNESQKMPLTESVVAPASIAINTGDIMYMATREKITRGANQTEEIRLILQF